MIDYVILTAYSPFAVIMQLHPGWVGFLQTQVLNCLGCLWFDRTEVRLPAPAMLRMLPGPAVRHAPVHTRPLQSCNAVQLRAACL